MIYNVSYDIDPSYDVTAIFFTNTWKIYFIFNNFCLIKMNIYMNDVHIYVSVSHDMYGLVRLHVHACTKYF